MTSLADRVRSYGPGEIAVLTFGATILAALFAAILPIPGVEILPAFVVTLGWFVLTPWALMQGWGDSPTAEAFDAADTTRRETGRERREAVEDPVERLRERYAAGEIGDAEFERQLEALLATENADPEAAYEAVSGDRPTETSRTLTDRE